MDAGFDGIELQGANVARFYMLAAQAAPASAVYNCTGETDISTEELAQAVGEAGGSSGTVFAAGRGASAFGRVSDRFRRLR